ncbi:cytochrome c biogenesis protein CcdA [Candidatus Woesearchaeota archaeon]|nr:cytochrome c biogenesis protein CcdA [Candidatus Woesearchaeota archaeon]
MAAALRIIASLLLFLLLAASYAAAQNAEDSGIEKQLNILQKLQDYNRFTAESTLRNVTFLIAFLGGILSFLAPCTVALLPAFLAYTAKSRRNITLTTLEFFGGFSLAFIALGIALTALGRVSFVTFQQDIAVLVQASGIILIALGVMMFFGKGFSFIHLRGRLPKDAPGTFIFGALFAIGWSACIGPVIAGIFTMAAVFNNYAYTALLLFFYALGLAIPLFAVSFAYDRFNLAESRLIRGFAITLNVGKKKLLLASTNIISGLLLIFLGALFIISRGTTIITAADLLGMIFLLAVLGAATLVLHKFVISRLIASSNARKLAAVVEIFAALAIFAFITHKYQVRTTGLTERLSDAVLENTAKFNFVAAAVLLAFAALLLYFVKRQLKAEAKR